jgi:sec-independent protein translocase protein TatC
MSEPDTIANPDLEPNQALALSAAAESATASALLADAEAAAGAAAPAAEFPGEVEMTLVDHLEELRRRVLRSLLAVVIAAAACLAFVKPLVKLLELPATGVRFLQLAPGEFLFVSLKVAGYAGLTLALPWVLF